MIKIAKELNNVIVSLEENGKYVEAKELHNVFIKVAQFEGAIAGALGGAIAPAVGNALSGFAKGVGNLFSGATGAGLSGGAVAAQNAGGLSANYQNLIEEYKNRFLNELKLTNNGNAPASSQYYNSVLQGNVLTEPEKQAFRAQAYRIRTEVRNQLYGMGDTSKIGNRGNINLLVENVVKVSGLYNEKDPANVDRYFPLIMSSIEQQILQRISPNERPRYLESAKKLVSTYINRQKAVLQNSAMQPR